MSKKKRDDLDTQTTIADMNVEGFRWYDPSRKKNGERAEKTPSVKMTRKERRAATRGAFLAMLPLICCMLLALAAVFLLAKFWVS